MGLASPSLFCAPNEGNCRSICIEGRNFELENAGLAGEVGLVDGGDDAESESASLCV
jgi:hypothetical protein